MLSGHERLRHDSGCACPVDVRHGMTACRHARHGHPFAIGGGRQVEEDLRDVVAHDQQIDRGFADDLRGSRPRARDGTRSARHRRSLSRIRVGQRRRGAAGQSCRQTASHAIVSSNCMLSFRIAGSSSCSRVGLTVRRYRAGRSMSTTSEFACSCRNTISRPSGEMSKSPMRTSRRSW